MTGLYRTPRTYFDHLCTEYQHYPIKQKLLDIGYATWQGHDIMEDIREILENHPHVSEDDLRLGLYQLHGELTHIDPMVYYIKRKKNSLETEVRAFVEDLIKVYRLPAGDRWKAYLADDPSRICFHELSAMNGWREALIDERQPYQMYSYGHWIMFPGDGEIIRRFNLKNIEDGKGYISYVYPEPWYGSPTRAEVIILGGEVRYDYFISVCQNLLLSRERAIMESVQLLTDSWLELEGREFYDEEFVSRCDDRVRVSDLYNSPTYRFWLTKVWELIDYLDLSRHKVYDNIAVINANPYPTCNVNPLEPGLLPSHYFLRQMVRFVVVRNPEVVFLLPSEKLRPLWQTILGDVYDAIVSHNRLFMTGSGNHISLIHNLDEALIKKMF